MLNLLYDTFTATNFMDHAIWHHIDFFVKVWVTGVSLCVHDASDLFDKLSILIARIKQSLQPNQSACGARVMRLSALRSVLRASRRATERPVAAHARSAASGMAPAATGGKWESARGAHPRSRAARFAPCRAARTRVLLAAALNGHTLNTPRVSSHRAATQRRPARPRRSCLWTPRSTPRCGLEQAPARGDSGAALRALLLGAGPTPSAPPPTQTRSWPSAHQGPRASRPEPPPPAPGRRCSVTGAAGAPRRVGGGGTSRREGGRPVPLAGGPRLRGDSEV